MISSIIQLIILGAIVGAGARALFVHNRQLSIPLAGLVGAVAIVILGLILSAAGLDNGLGVVIAIAGTVVVVLVAASLSPVPIVSRAPKQVGKDVTRTAAGSDERVLQEFDVPSVGLNDGVGHSLGQARCTLTSRRLIIDDVRGGIHQIPLKEVARISVPGPLVSPKQLRVSLPTISYDVYCNSKDQRTTMEYWLSKAIRGDI